MKKVFVVALAVSILAGIAVAQYGSGSDMKSDSSASAPLKNIKGTVKADGGKTWFVADKDSKSGAVDMTPAPVGLASVLKPLT